MLRIPPSSQGLLERLPLCVRLVLHLYVLLSAGESSVYVRNNIIYLDHKFFSRLYDLLAVPGQLHIPDVKSFRKRTARRLLAGQILEQMISLVHDAVVV